MTWWICVALAVARRAEGHAPFQITAGARVRADRLDVHIVMGADTAAVLCLDDARDSTAGRHIGERPSITGASKDTSTHASGGASTDASVEVSAGSHLGSPHAGSAARLETCTGSLYAVTAGGGVLSPTAVRAAPLSPTGGDVAFWLVYPRPARNPLTFEARRLDRLPDDAAGGVELTVSGEGAFLGQALLRADAPTLTVIVPDVDTGTPGAPAAPQAGAPRPGFGPYLRLGVRHILTGTDHLLFLAGLLLVCGSLRAVLTIVTCFTVAHSITLALAVLGAVRLDGRVVEPLIAATIVFVGVENLWRGDEPQGRAVLTFAFGLLHGLGFASALRQIGLGAPGAPLVLPLLAFNLGVELGQVGLATVLVPALWSLRAAPWFGRRGVRLLSLLVAAVGAFWLLQRTIGS